ncbi:probable disease resistance protein At4g27220 isoform X6 [Eucalyptus grandis]|nr:probable disease resistance protein At4g27220 isoform X5 [Eucalyptus grandis]XP_039171520.1 probable disease resistance protein At4g27220 isoform X6 [Eucalyptus grandis]
MDLPSRSLPALTNMPRPLNAEEGEPITEVPHGSSASLPLPLMDLPSRSLPALTNMPRPLNAEEGEPIMEVPHEEGAPDAEVLQGEMPRATYPFSKLVEVLPNNKRKCNLPASGFVTKKINVHFAGVGGCGIRDYKLFDDRVRSEALEALKGERAVEGSSNLTQGSHQPLTASNEGARSKTSFVEKNQPSRSFPALTNMPRPMNAKGGEPNTEVPHGARMQVASAESQQGTRRLAKRNMTFLESKLEELISSGQGDMSKLNSKWMEEEYWRVVRAIREGSVPPEKVAEVVELFKEVLLAPGRFWQAATTLVRRSKTSPLVTTELVGKETQLKVNEIFSNLKQDNFSRIGVYGMGGVGKTAILTHVYNRLLEDLDSDVFWVAVPQDFSVYALQEEIANAVGLDNLSNEKDVRRRAGLLYGHLNMKNRSILILDGLWMHFEVKEVGIPVETGKLKLVVTTRSLEVCRMMLCQKQIKIGLLDMEDTGWLFSKTLCVAGLLPSEVEQIASSLLDRCCGLPLAIIEIATRLRGVEKVHEWRDMLGKLEDSKMELDVFKRLQLSYVNLGNDQVQQCFLHLILRFGEALVLSGASGEEELIESFIDEGLLGGIATRQGLHDQGNTILDKIRGSCLLDPDIEYRCLHPLTRDMALRMVTSTTHIVKACMGLKEIPEEVFWNDHLEKVFLQGNDIEEIPDGISPNCPKLTSLYLNGNDMLGVIHESFFRHLKGLTVLDLCYTGITELPDSISQLESLEALLLQSCLALRFIPSVGKLGSLRKLDLQGCQSLEEAPEGMEMLVKLRYLALDGTMIETLPEGVLEKLVNLQYLAIEKLRAGEEVKSTKLEALYCSVAHVETFNACVGSLVRNSCRRYTLAAPNAYRLWLVDDPDRSILIDGWDHIAASVDGTSGDGCALLPESVQSLELSRCHKIKRVVEWEWLTTLLPNLEKIIVHSCEKLEEIIHGPLPSRATCRLTYLEVSGCNNIKRELLTEDMLLHLPFLQEILVKDCKGIEVIIGTVAEMTHRSFPKITNLGLWNLPELKSICDGTTSWDTLRQISIDNCPKLKRIPLQLPLLDNGPPPSLREIRINQQTWESLEWDHPLVRSSLEPSVKFLD